MTDRHWAAFGAPYRIRFDEAGPDGLVRTSALLRYAQDVAWLHSVAREFDRAWYRQRGLNWVVRAVDLEVRRPIPLGATLEATTQVLGQRRVWARRLGEFQLDGTPAAHVTTDWLLLDRAGRPTRLPPEFDGAFAALPAADGLTRVRLPDPPDDAPRRAIRVRQPELDPMAHVNNAVYLDWLEDCVVAASGTAGSIQGLPRRARLEYAGSAGPGDDLRATTWPLDDGWAHRVETTAGEELVRGMLTSGSPIGRA